MSHEPSSGLDTSIFQHVIDNGGPEQRLALAVQLAKFLGKDGVLMTRDFEKEKFEMIDQIIENQGDILVNQIPQALTTVISQRQSAPQPKPNPQPPPQHHAY